MATPYSPVPLGQSGTGQAFVLGTDSTALNILRQGEAARRRQAQLEEQLRQKQLQQDAKDYLDASKFNLEGGRIFQKGLTDVVAPEAQQRLQALYQDKTLTPMQRSMKAREIQNGYEGERQMTLQKQQTVDNFLKTSIADPEINQEGVALSLAEAAKGKDGPLRASQFNEDDITNGILAKASVYNAPVVVQNAIKGIQPAITEAVAQAGKVGGTHSQLTTTARFYDIDPTTHRVRTKDGQPIISINDDSLALLKQNKRFSLLVEDRVARAQEQGIVLDEKKAAADLIGPYASYKETASAGRNAQPRAASGAGKPKYTINLAPAQEGFTVHGGTTDTGEVITTPGASDPLTALRSGRSMTTTVQPVIATNYGSYGQMPQPTVSTPTNPSKPLKFEGLNSRRLLQPDDKGNYSLVTNNAQPIYGTAGPAIAVLRNPKTGEYKLPSADEATARKQAAEYLNKGWIIGTAVKVAVPKNKNFTAEYGPILQRLKAENDAPADPGSMSITPKRRKSEDELKDEAFKLAATATVNALIPYDEETQGSIDNQTGGAYRAFHQQQGQRGKALRTAQTTKADPFGFGSPPAAAKPAAPKASKVKTVGKNNALGF
jgi:hypothetical protein